LHVGASGKVLLAFSERSVIEELLDDPNWPADANKDEFLAALENVREQRYAVSIEEREPGAAAVAAPVLSRTGEIVAALSVSGPVDRFTPEAIERHAQALKHSSDILTKMLTH